MKPLFIIFLFLVTFTFESIGQKPLASLCTYTNDQLIPRGSGLQCKYLSVDFCDSCQIVKYKLSIYKNGEDYVYISFLSDSNVIERKMRDHMRDMKDKDIFLFDNIVIRDRFGNLRKIKPLRLIMQRWN